MFHAVTAQLREAGKGLGAAPNCIFMAFLQRPVWLDRRSQSGLEASQQFNRKEIEMSEAVKTQ
jgi:hypothetical protein